MESPMSDIVEHGLDQLRWRVDTWDKSSYMLIE